MFWGGAEQYPPQRFYQPKLGDKVVVRDQGRADRWKLGDVVRVGAGGRCLVKPRGWKNAFEFREVQEAQIAEGCVCKAKSDAAIFESVSSWDHYGDLRQGDEVVVAGPPEEADGYTMVPLEQGGAVEFDALEITAITEKDEDEEGGGGFPIKKVSLLLALAWVTVGVIAFMTQRWALGEQAHDLDTAIYFMAQLITTVGYGDITPITQSGWLFISFYVLFAAVVFSTIVSSLASALVEKQADIMRKALDKVVEDGEAVDLGRGCCHDEVVSFLRALAVWVVFLAFGTVFFSKFCEWPVADVVDVIIPGDSSNVSNVSTTLLRTTTVATTTVTTLGNSSAAARLLGAAPECEDRDMVAAFYMSVITLTTVGFGDQVPKTYSGKWVASLWMIFGVAAFGNMVGKFSAMFVANQHGLKSLSEKWLDKMFEDPVLQQCMKEANRNVPAVGRAEFILFMLQQVGAADPALVDALNQNFSDLDVDRSGQLDENDLRRVNPQPRQELAGRPGQYAALAEQS